MDYDEARLDSCEAYDVLALPPPSTIRPTPPNQVQVPVGPAPGTPRNPMLTPLPSSTAPPPGDVKPRNINDDWNQPDAPEIKTPLGPLQLWPFLPFGPLFGPPDPQGPGAQPYPQGPQSNDPKPNWWERQPAPKPPNLPPPPQPTTVTIPGLNLTPPSQQPPPPQPQQHLLPPIDDPGAPMPPWNQRPAPQLELDHVPMPVVPDRT